MGLHHWYTEKPPISTSNDLLTLIKDGLMGIPIGLFGFVSTAVSQIWMCLQAKFLTVI